MTYKYDQCSCCGGGFDGNMDCPNYCQGDPCPCPSGLKRQIASQITTRKSIVEACEDGYMAMDEEGFITVHRTAVEVVRALKRRDKANAQKGLSTATLIEWINVPEGFVPPSVEE